MNISLAELALPIRIRPEVPMTDDELLRFCAANDPLRVERDADGELIITICRPGQAPEVHHHPSSVQGDGIMAGFELLARIWE